MQTHEQPAKDLILTDAPLRSDDTMLGAIDEDDIDLISFGNCSSCLSVSPEVEKMIIW